MKYKFYKEGDTEMVEITIDDHNKVCRPATEKDREDAKADDAACVATQSAPIGDADEKPKKKKT